MFQRMDVVPGTGDVPVAPLRRERSLALTPVQVARGAESHEDEGPKRLVWYERFAENGDHRGC